MAGHRRPSFLKRQKEQKRLERASAKRADRQARRDARGAAPADDEPVTEREDGAGGPADAPEPGDDRPE